MYRCTLKLQLRMGMQTVPSNGDRQELSVVVAVIAFSQWKLSVSCIRALSRVVYSRSRRTVKDVITSPVVVWVSIVELLLECCLALSSKHAQSRSSAALLSWSLSCLVGSSLLEILLLLLFHTTLLQNAVKVWRPRAKGCESISLAKRQIFSNLRVGHSSTYAKHAVNRTLTAGHSATSSE